MSQNPNLKATDKDGNELADRQLEINGIVPGEGGDEGYFVLDGGTLLPVADVDVVDLSGVTVDASEFAQTAEDVDAIPTAEKGAAEGVATLDSSGDLESGQVPSIAITDVYPDLESDDELTTLSNAEQGDVGIVNSDGEDGGSYMLADEPYSERGNWKELKTREPPVTSVHGRAGDVTADAGDYDEFYAPLEEGVARGPIAERPDTGPYDDFLYAATDQDLTWRWDETANDWSVFGHGTEADPVPSGHYESVSTERVSSDSGVLEQRLNAMYEANRIRTGAGVPPNADLGPQSVGLSDSSALSGSSSLSITSESDASSAASSGSGTETDPYIIDDLDFTGASSPAIAIDDPSLDYHILFSNVLVPDNSVSIEGGVDETEFVSFEYSKIYNSNRAVYIIDGALGMDNVHISGQDGSELQISGEWGSIRTDNCLFDDADVSGASRRCIYFTAPGSFDISNTRFGTGYAAVLEAGTSVSGSIEKSIFDNNRPGDIVNLPGTAEINDVTIHKCEFREAEGHQIRAENVVHNDRPESYSRGKLALEVSHCYFGDTPDGYRQVFLTADSNNRGVRDARVHHCRFNKPTGGIMEAGNECLETFPLGERVEFDHCWSEACPEDSFEHAEAVGDVHIHHCVGDNVQGQIVDYFGSATGQGGATTTGGSIGGEVHHIYGSCRDVGVILTDVSDVRVDGHIHIEHYDGRGEPLILVEQRNDSAGNSPNNITIKGPLSLAENIDGELVDSDGTIGSNNWAIWLEGNEIQTWDPDNTLEDDWAEIR